MAFAAQLLDELMGRDRNLAPTEKRNEVRWEDGQACKYFLCGFCPHELFVNTRADLGPCEKIHDDELRKQYEKSARFSTMGYEEEFLRFLQSLLSDVERRIRRGHARLALNSTQGGLANTSVTVKEEKVELLTERINELVEQAEQLGCEGKVEEAQGVMKLCEQLREERSQLEMNGSNAVPQLKEMEVCDICGAFLVIGDAQQRLEEHLMGKQHMGFAKVRLTIENLKAKLRGEDPESLRVAEEERKKREKEREDREKEREKEREERKKKDAEREKERKEREEKRKKKSRSRSRSRKRSRSRSRDRRRRSRSRGRRSRSRDRHRRSRSRDRRSRSRDRRSRGGRRSRSKDRVTRTKDRSRSRERRRSRSKDRRRSRSKDRKNSQRSRSRERRSRSREGRSRDNDRRRSRSRDKKRSRSDSRSHRSKSKDKHANKDHDKDRHTEKDRYADKDRHADKDKDQDSKPSHDHKDEIGEKRTSDCEAERGQGDKPQDGQDPAHNNDHVAMPAEGQSVTVTTSSDDVAMAAGDTV